MMSAIDFRTILLLLVAAALVALGCSLLLAPVRDVPAEGDAAAAAPPRGTPVWRLLGGLVALLGLAAGSALIWPGLDRATAGTAMILGVLLFGVGLVFRRRTLPSPSDRPGATPRPQLGILLTGTGIAMAAMVLGVGLLGRLV